MIGLSAWLRVSAVVISVAVVQPASAAGDPGSALFPMDWVPFHETPDEISAREQRLEKLDQQFAATLLAAKEAGRLDVWIESFLPELDLRRKAAESDDDDESAGGQSVYKRAHRLLAITCFALDEGCPELKPVLVSKLLALQDIAGKKFLAERQNDINKTRAGESESKYLGYPFDLNTCHPFNAILICASAMKLLGEYDGELRGRTEEWIKTYIENKGRFTGHWLSGGYNKEVFHMEIGGWIEFLYADTPGKYPVARKTFKVCWDGWMRDFGYDGDNSPHYDAGTGIPVLMRLAFFLGKTDDLLIRSDFRRIANRMAHTIMNSGETAKWGKSMGGGRPPHPDASLFVSAGDGMPWTLKMASRLFEDPLLLYAARKYEDRLLQDRTLLPKRSRGPDIPDIFPAGINQWQVRGAAFPQSAPLSLTTARLTHVEGEKKGNRIGRGDKKTGLVQDKLILRTGTHPQSPYFLMDLSFSQSKNAPDHRIGIDNLQFDTIHSGTYVERPGNGNHINQPLIAPVCFPFPLVPASSGEVSPSGEYLEKLGRTDDYKSYVLRRFSATNLSSGAAFGVADYSRFQYEGVSTRREMVLLHNGVLVVLDTIIADSSFRGDFNAGVIYQIWPGVQTTSADLRWVLQSPHYPAAPELARSTNGFPTLFLFPETGQPLAAHLQKDPMNPSKRVPVTAYSVHTALTRGARLVIPSIVAPIRNASAVADWTAAVEVTVDKSCAVIRFPAADGGRMVVTFNDGEPAEVTTR